MPPDLQDEFEPECYTREEALSIARTEALRGLEVGPKSISYVGHLKRFHDYCFCEFALEDGRWIKTLRGLTPEERLPGVEIQDRTIVDLARSGNMISAIRLYRTKHQIGLREAVDAVNALQYGEP
jgi:hypothetical protein